MRLIRSLLALALLKAGNWLLGRAAGLRLVGSMSTRKPGPTSTRYRPADRMLLGSIVGLAICALWIWIGARTGR